MLSNADLADAIACVVRFRASSIANNEVERWLRAVSLRKRPQGRGLQRTKTKGDATISRYSPSSNDDRSVYHLSLSSVSGVSNSSYSAWKPDSSRIPSWTMVTARFV
jgi:hypothetical protein